jgi:hypothetical protein
MKKSDIENNTMVLASESTKKGTKILSYHITLGFYLSYSMCSENVDMGGYTKDIDEAVLGYNKINLN